MSAPGWAFAARIASRSEHCVPHRPSFVSAVVVTTYVLPTVEAPAVDPIDAAASSTATATGSPANLYRDPLIAPPNTDRMQFKSRAPPARNPFALTNGSAGTANPAGGRINNVRCLTVASPRRIDAVRGKNFWA